MTWGPSPALGVTGSREGLGLLQAGSPSSRGLHTPGARRVNGVPPPGYKYHLCPTRMSSGGYFGWVPAALGMCWSGDLGGDVTVTGTTSDPAPARGHSAAPQKCPARGWHSAPPYQKGGFGQWVSTSTLRAGVSPHHPLPRALPCPLSGCGGWRLAPHGELSLVLLPWGGSGHHRGILGCSRPIWGL